MTTPSSKDDTELDATLADLLNSVINATEPERRKAVAETKQAILNKYIARADVEQAIEKLKIEMQMHTVPEGTGLITRSYLNNSLDFMRKELNVGEPQ